MQVSCATALPGFPPEGAESSHNSWPGTRDVGEKAAQSRSID